MKDTSYREKLKKLLDSEIELEDLATEGLVGYNVTYLGSDFSIDDLPEGTLPFSHDPSHPYYKFYDLAMKIGGLPFNPSLKREVRTKNNSDNE